MASRKARDRRRASNVDVALRPPSKRFPAIAGLIELCVDVETLLSFVVKIERTGNLVPLPGCVSLTNSGYANE